MVNIVNNSKIKKTVVLLNWTHSDIRK